ncbi:unnamed protein product [Closterium sp. Yama58-4]|nr:unnamed protein product [Closterium sp. Yama58-4]
MSSPSLFPRFPTSPAAYPPLTRALRRRSRGAPFATLRRGRLSTSFAAPSSSGGAEAQKIVYVGGSSNRLLSPWGFAMKDWKAPKVLPGDSLVFQWSGEVHSVHKVDAADYAACTFLHAKQLARNRNYGSYWYKVNWREYGKTIYFSSKANNDCSVGIKRRSLPLEAPPRHTPSHALKLRRAAFTLNPTASPVLARLLSKSPNRRAFSICLAPRSSKVRSRVTATLLFPLFLVAFLLTATLPPFPSPPPSLHPRPPTFFSPFPLLAFLPRRHPPPPPPFRNHRCRIAGVRLSARVPSGDHDQRSPPFVATSGGAEAQKVVYVGGNMGRWLSPWGFAVKDWKAPKVLPGDLLVFQWMGEVHSVHKVDAADYAACTFLNATPLARNRNYGNYVYKVVPKDYGNTIYFTSKANSDCSDGIKAALVVGSCVGNMDCTDPKEVASRLGNIAFGNVIAAAARDLKKEKELSQKNASAAVEDDFDLDDLADDPELEKLHAERLQSMMAESRKRENLRKKGHGEYREITEEEFLPEVKSSDRVICHFYHSEFPRCKIVDKHLAILAPKHLEAKFVKIDAEKCPFFVSRLNIKVLPCIILLRDAVAFHRIVGFEAFRNRDNFSTSELENYLTKQEILELKEDEDAEEEDENKGRSIQASALSSGYE